MECQMWGEELRGHVKRFDLDPFEVEPGGAVGLGKDNEVVVNESEEMMKGLGKGKRKIGSGNEKALKALKNHSDAERRRRERINMHLDALRALVHSNEKMDKATLLAEVINLVKDQQKQAKHVSEGLLMPFDADELTVEPIHNESKSKLITFKVTLCCDFRPDIFTDLRHAIRSLKLKTLHSEISTLGDRLKALFTLTSHDDEWSAETLVNAIRQSLSCVLYKPSPLHEYSSRTTLSHKRFKTPLDDYSPRSVLPHKRFKYSESSSPSP